MAGREGAPCGACKFLRRKCVEGCVFAPYFSSEELSTSHFAAIHKIFGASNFSKLLLHIPSKEQRYDAVVSISYEAEARLQDPIHGCVSYVFSLQQQVAQLQAELTFARARLVGCSAGTSLSPLYVDLKDSEPPSSYQDASETTEFYHHNKFSCLQDYNHNPLYADQQNNVFQDYRN